MLSTIVRSTIGSSQATLAAVIRCPSALLLAALAIAIPAHSQPVAATVVRGGDVLDVSTGKVERNTTLIVRGGRIVARGRTVRIPPDARIIDAAGLTLMPGLIDTHVHVTLGGRPRDNALATLKAGFTTVA